MKRVIGIGNALTDMLVNLKDDQVLERYNIARGSMSLVDSLLQSEVSKAVAGRPYSLSLGGSADNTIRAMARLGGDVGFIGKDIFSPQNKGFAYFGNAAWLDDKMYYVPSDAQPDPKELEHIQMQNKRVQESFEITEIVVTGDYFAHK